MRNYIQKKYASESQVKALKESVYYNLYTPYIIAEHTVTLKDKDGNIAGSYDEELALPNDKNIKKILEKEGYEFTYETVGLQDLLELLPHNLASKITYNAGYEDIQQWRLEIDPYYNMVSYAECDGDRVLHTCMSPHFIDSIIDMLLWIGKYRGYNFIISLPANYFNPRYEATPLLPEEK